MSKVLPFPFLVKVWNGSVWKVPSVYRFPSGFMYVVRLYHSYLLDALAECDFLRDKFGVEACVFLDDLVLSSDLYVPRHV